MPVALLALSVGAFAIGATGFVIMGLLVDISNDLRISLTVSGFLISGYAIGVAFGAPALTVLMREWRRRNVLLALMAIFVAGNVGCAIAPTRY